jgi:hypothetical protein
MKKQTKTNKKQWIKPEIQVLVVNSTYKSAGLDASFFKS